ncbi:MAG: hypothetical protein EON56_05835, partial [Alphaproteobacteria bacterium]
MDSPRGEIPWCEAKPECSLASIGKAMVIVGLVIQIISFGLFMVTSAIFHKRLTNDLTLKALSSDVPWVRILR